MAALKYAVHFRSADGCFGLSLPKRNVKELIDFCRNAGNVETGGILIGKYSEDQATPVVDQVTGPPPDSKHFFAHFLRGVQGLQELLNRAWTRRDRRFYLGEWHYHPAASTPPSKQDIEQMFEIARDSKYACPEPALLVVARVDTMRYRFSAVVYTRGGLTISMAEAHLSDSLQT